MKEDFAHLLYQLHLSYFQARKNKRNTVNQLKFELEQEHFLYQLAENIYQRTYTPRPSIAFIIRKPVVREIFAADFSDRIIHHLLYRCIYPIIDNKLIHDTYSCREGKGTLYGINRIKKFIRSCSDNYHRETYILKLDVEAYFMNMKHQIIYDKVLAMLPPEKSSYLGISKETICYLLQQTIFNSVKENYHIKGSHNDWKELPPTKSLFYYPNDTGLPIGNLTSQVFGNIYMNDFDQYVKKELKMKYYGRYVDDMVFIHQDKQFLHSILPLLQKELDKVDLQIHPKKIILVPAEAGIDFLGQRIKPYRNYIGDRTKNNFYQTIQRINKILEETQEVSWQQLCEIRTVLNSYLGYMLQASSFRLRKSMMRKLSQRFYHFFFVTRNVEKVIINEKYWEWHFLPNYPSIN